MAWNNNPNDMFSFSLLVVSMTSINDTAAVQQIYVT